MVTLADFSKSIPDLFDTLIGNAIGMGNIWFVDSGAEGGSDSPGKGRSVIAPFSSLAYAVGQVAATNGDVIFLAPGHGENVSAADGIRFALAGINVIGIGHGTARPTLTLDTVVTADIEIDADNITIRNVYFDLTGIDNITAAIDVNAAQFSLINCYILQADSGGQAAIAIELDANANNCKILGCEISSINAGAASAIKINGTLVNLEIGHCWIDGDYTDAPIHNPTSNVATQLNIHHCYLKNDNNLDHSIELVSACTGALRHNDYHTNGVTLPGAVDPGSCFSFENYAANADADTSAILDPVAT